MLEFIALGMVLEKPLTGYDIKKNIERGVGVFYKASYGSLYPALKKLTKKGYLVMCEHLHGSRQKKYYQILDNGKAAFLEWISSPIDSTDSMDTHLAKVYFFDKLTVDVRNRLLLEYEVYNFNYLRKLQALEKQFNEMPNSDCFYYKLSTLYYGIRIIQENLRWCEHIRARKPLPEFISKEKG